MPLPSKKPRCLELEGAASCARGIAAQRTNSFAACKNQLAKNQSGNHQQERISGRTFFRCLVPRGFASAAKGFSEPGRAPALHALWLAEVSPVIHHRLNLYGQGTSDRGKSGVTHPVGSNHLSLFRRSPEVSAIFATDRFQNCALYVFRTTSVPLQDIHRRFQQLQVIHKPTSAARRSYITGFSLCRYQGTSSLVPIKAVK
jgi:hypothetical protein